MGIQFVGELILFKSAANQLFLRFRQNEDLSHIVWHQEEAHQPPEDGKSTLLEQTEQRQVW